MKDFVEKPAGVAVIGNAELFVKMHEGVAGVIVSQVMFVGSKPR